MPNCFINHDENLQVVEELKLLGVIITSELDNPQLHVQESICQVMDVKEVEAIGSHILESY